LNLFKITVFLWDVAGSVSNECEEKNTKNKTAVHFLVIQSLGGWRAAELLAVLAAREMPPFYSIHANLESGHDQIFLDNG